MDNAQLINQDSGKVEYYTPSWIAEAAEIVVRGNYRFRSCYVREMANDRQLKLLST
jgi:hypothetical protein